jgi:hypothetical protein
MGNTNTTGGARAEAEREEEVERGLAARSAVRSAAAREATPLGAGLIESAMGHHKHTEGTKTRLQRFDDIAALLLKIVTVLALTFGLFEYDRQKADARVTQSLSLVQEWESGGYREAYGRINDLLWPIYEQNATAITGVGNDEAARSLLYGNIGEAVTGKDDAFVSQPDKDVDMIFHFFERAAICADQAICDYGVLKTFFGSESASFWLYFAKYAERRQNDGFAGYGEWTRKFVTGDIRRAKFLGVL